MGDEDWHRVISINLSGAFFVAQTALEHMLERGTGRIISISSAIGEIGNIGQANYAASKSGLFGLTKSLARETVFMLQRAGKPGGRRPRADGQLRDAGIHRYRHAGQHPGQGDGAGRGQIPSAGSASRRRSRAWSRSSRKTSRRTSPGRSGPSTAAWTCEMRRVMEEVFVLSAVRTPIGKYGGGLASVPPCDLAAKVVREAVSRSGAEPGPGGPLRVRQRDPHRGQGHVPGPGRGPERRPAGRHARADREPAVRQRAAGHRVRLAVDHAG